MTHPKEVLLVDNEENQSRILQMLMQTRGYEVKTAFSGAEVFRKVTPDCDLVVLDLILPDIDGFEVCRRLKQDEQLKHIPIIILSAYSACEDRVRSFYLGVDDFLAKPCEHEELFARMDAVFRRSNGFSCGDKKTLAELYRIFYERDVVSYYQPIYQLQPFGLLGFETLTRAVTRSHLKNSEHFFKIALQSGIYPQFELLSWSNALSVIGKKNYSGKIFLNCNPYFIESVEFGRVLDMIKQYRIDPRNVVFEITEMSAILDFQLFYEKLKPYKDHGFSFAIDDLGRGYSSLESLVEIHPQFVKIDGYIIRNLYNDDLKRSIVEFVVGFCRKHGILVVGEGIETQKDFESACALGLDAGQGYYFCKPQKGLYLEAFENFSKSRKFSPSGNFFSI